MVLKLAFRGARGVQGQTADVLNFGHVLLEVKVVKLHPLVDVAEAGLQDAVAVASCLGVQPVQHVLCTARNLDSIGQVLSLEENQGGESVIWRAALERVFLRHVLKFLKETN